MTRLRSEQLPVSVEDVERYDQEIRKVTGASVELIARRIACFNSCPSLIPSRVNVAVVPVTAGEGIITGFATAVQSILTYLGFAAFVTKRNDISGIAEAVERGADLVFGADDTKFVAINLKKKYCVDNGAATGRSYAGALEFACRGGANKNVLIIGLGSVGLSAGKWLVENGASILGYDIEREKRDYICSKYKWQPVNSVREGMFYTDLVVDASPGQDIIQAEWLTANCIIAAPGIPLGLASDAYEMVLGRALIHEPLALGVAAMAWEALVAGQRY